MAAFYVIGTVLYLILASGEEQEWAKPVLKGTVIEKDVKADNNNNQMKVVEELRKNKQENDNYKKVVEELKQDEQDKVYRNLAYQHEVTKM